MKSYFYQDILIVAMFAGDFLNSCGESDSTNSPLSTDGSIEPETGARLSFSPPQFETTSLPPAEQRPPVSTSPRPPPPRIQLQPLTELGVVGACRRGRRKGRRNRTPTEREAESAGQRTSKNTRERIRVQNVNQEYENLRLALGAPASVKGKVKKVATLNKAIAYIKSLMSELDQLRRQAGEPPLRPTESTASSSSSSSDSSSSSSTCTQTHTEEAEEFTRAEPETHSVTGTPGASEIPSDLDYPYYDEELDSLLSSSVFFPYPDYAAAFEEPLEPAWSFPPPLSHCSPSDPQFQ